MTVSQSHLQEVIRAAHCSQCHARPSQYQIDSDGWCCQCYVEAGHPPADWHRACMATYERISKRTTNR